jgi:hypothetical protein
MRKELDELLAAAGLDLEWADIVRDLDRVEEVTVDQTTSASCCAPRRRDVPVPCARPSASPCRRSSNNFPPRHRRPRRQITRNAAAAGRGVVPRDREFPELPRQIRDLPIHGVENQS